MSRLWPSAGGAAFALSQGRHAQTVMLAVLKRRGLLAPSVWLPAFYGRCMLAPILASSARLVSYPMTASFNPDWPRLEALVAAEGPPDLLFLGHFYGMEAEGRAARQFADRHGALLFEDAVHFMLPEGEVGRHGDFVSFSPRKFYGTPDGSILAVNRADLARDVEALAPSLPSPEQQLSATRFVMWRDRLPWRRRRGPVRARDFDQDYDGEPGFSSSVWMSRPTFRRIEQLGVAGAQRLAAAERRIVETLECEIPKLTGLRPLPRLPVAVPYLVGFRGASREAAERAYLALSRAGAIVGTWPDIPREVRAEPERYGAALELRNTVLRVTPRNHARRHPLDFLDAMPAAAEDPAGGGTGGDRSS